MKTRAILKTQFLSSSVWLTSLVIGLLMFSACGGRATSTLRPPAGAAAGLNTFIYFYTDN